MSLVKEELGNFTQVKLPMTDELRRACKLKQAKLDILLPEALHLALKAWLADELAEIAKLDADRVA